MKILNLDANFQDLFDHTSDLIHFLDIEGRILAVNPAWASHMGVCKEEVEGRNIYDFIDPQSRESYQSYRNLIVNRVGVTDIEFEFRGRDGGKVLVEGQIGCVYQDGKPVYTRGVFKDITSRRAAEVALGRNQQRLAAFLNSAPSAVIIIDEYQTVLEWNPKAESIFGFRSDEVLSRPLGDIIIPAQFREAHARGMAHFLRTGEGPVLNKTIEVSALHKNGYEFPISLSISSVKIEGNWLFIAFISDITDYKLLQQEVIRNEAALLQSKVLDDKKDQFLSMASHELKTPLTSLKAYIQILERNISSGTALPLQFLGKASEYITKLENLISDLLDVSKIKADKVTYNIEEFQFDHFLTETVESLRYTSSTHRIILEENVSATCRGDKMRIEQVIQNLVSNAIKFSPAAGEITIGSRLRNNEIEVYVSDQGIGISPDKLNNVFDRFYRVDDNEMKFPGLGIGLFISRDIIERHKGQLWVESEPGKGSTFYFSLPRVD
jgi:two-component system, LuxR family, sensor kinase FixL